MNAHPNLAPAAPASALAGHASRADRASQVRAVRLSARYARLLETATRFDRGDHAGARALLRGFPRLQVDRDGDDLKCFVFLRALSQRLEEGFDHPGNLYLRDFAFPQIDLFNLMAERLPLIRGSAEAANHLLLCEMLQKDDPVLVDVGIGTGRQAVALLRMAAESGARFDRIRIVGVEPSAASLRAASDAIACTARELQLNVEFQPVAGCIESLSVDDWAALRRVSRGAVFNEAFALHHVAQRRDAFDLKDLVLKRIADLEPSLFVMAEPHSDHQSTSIAARFANAWRHFGAVFDVIDRIDATRGERDAMKILFFAREVDDVLAAPEVSRCERHETAEMWLARLERAGLRPRTELSACDDRTQDGVRFAWKGDHLGLDVRGETVVSLIAAAP